LGGFNVGFGLSLSTPAIIALVVGSTVAGACIIHHAKGKHKHHKHHAYFGGEGSQHEHLDIHKNNFAPSGMIPGNNSIDIGDMVMSNIRTRCKNHHQVDANIERILSHIRSYEIYLRPLLQKRMDGKISEWHYQKRLRTIIDHIAHEAQIPMHSGHHIIKPDLINHDGSTDDTDLGGPGWYSPTPPDKWRFEHPPHLHIEEATPRIQDVAARLNFAAFTSIGASDDIQHIGMARANNVEIANDPDYHAVNFTLPVDESIFTST
jgi:hypothetical protein